MIRPPPEGGYGDSTGELQPEGPVSWRREDLDQLPGILGLERVPGPGKARFVGVARDDVEVQVEDDLSGDGSLVDPDVVIVAQSFDPSANLGHPPEDRRVVLRRKVRQTVDMLLRDHEHMAAAQREDVQERHDGFVLPDDVARGPASGDGAEDAISHLPQREGVTL